MEEKRLYSFYGYHGTAESCGRNIVETKTFEFGEPREDHWLGQGAYFFKDDEEQAEKWALSKVENFRPFRGEKPYLIEVNLNSNEENFLNLDTRRGLNYLLDHIKSLKSEGMEIEYDEDKLVSGVKVRCFVLSLVPDDIWMIQRTFRVKSKLFDRNKLISIMDLHLNGTQICVRNKNVINGNSIKGRTIEIEPRGKRKKPRLLLSE